MYSEIFYFRTFAKGRVGGHFENFKHLHVNDKLIE